MKIFCSRLFSGALLLSVLLGHFASAKEKPHEANEHALVCGKTDLKLKNCLLKINNLELHFTFDKIILNDHTWRGLEPLPLLGEKTDWSHIQLSSLGGRYFVELEIWDEPKGDLAIQTLRWIVAEIQGVKVKVLLRKDLQKRNPMSAEATPVKYKYDEKTNYSLKLQKDKGTKNEGAKNGKVIWTFRQEEGEI